jgi:hypothetical protein
MTTLEDILKQASSYTDQEATVPTGTDLTTRITYANRALNEWADYDDQEELTSTYPFSIPTSAISLPLPSGFRKPMSPLFVYETSDATLPSVYPLIPRDERFNREQTERFAYIDGNNTDGYTLIVPKGITAGVSTLMDIQSYPTSLLSLTDIPPQKSSEYMVQRIISLVLESRGDDKFPTARAEASIKLASMAEAQNAKNLGMNNQIPMNKNFVIGLD